MPRDPYIPVYIHTYVPCLHTTPHIIPVNTLTKKTPQRLEEQRRLELFASQGRPHSITNSDLARPCLVIFYFLFLPSFLFPTPDPKKLFFFQKFSNLCSFFIVFFYCFSCHLVCCGAMLIGVAPRRLRLACLKPSM